MKSAPIYDRDNNEIKFGDIVMYEFFGDKLYGKITGIDDIEEYNVLELTISYLPVTVPYTPVSEHKKNLVYGGKRIFSRIRPDEVTKLPDEDFVAMKLSGEIKLQ